MGPIRCAKVGEWGISFNLEGFQYWGSDAWQIDIYLTGGGATQNECFWENAF